MALTLVEVNRMVQTAIAKAEELQVKISVAVCDTGGNLIAFNRMSGAIVVSATVAQGKAAASAGFGRASGALQADSPVIQAVIASLGGRMLPARGAVPSTRPVNSSGPSVRAVPPLSKTSNVPRLGLLSSKRRAVRVVWAGTCWHPPAGAGRDQHPETSIWPPSRYRAAPLQRRGWRLA